MRFSDPLEYSGLSEEINRICGLKEGAVGNAVYANKAKAARINAALDRYFFLAHATDIKGSLDDKNYSAAPIETQNLVSGTNYYKFSSFTNEILGMLKLAILDSNGNETTLTHETLNEIANFGDRYKTSTTGIPSHWTRLGDFIYLYPCPNYDKTSGLRAYVERVPSRYTFVTFTVTIASPAVFTSPAHGLAVNDALIFITDGILPTGLTEDTTVYYVISTGLTVDNFRVSTTPGGSAVNTSGSQSGTHKFLKVSKEPGIPSIHHPYLARHAALPFLLTYGLPQLDRIKLQIVEDEIAIQEFFARREKDVLPRMTVNNADANSCR